MQSQQLNPHHRRHIQRITEYQTKSVERKKSNQYYMEISPRFDQGLTFKNQIKEVKIPESPQTQAISQSPKLKSMKCSLIQVERIKDSQHANQASPSMKKSCFVGKRIKTEY